MGGKEKEGDSVTWVAEGWESGGRKALFGAQDHQHQQRGVVRRAMRKAVVTFEEGREVKRRGCDGNG
jgi:hypothetical protein